MLVSSLAVEERTLHKRGADRTRRRGLAKEQAATRAGRGARPGAAGASLTAVIIVVRENHSPSQS